MKTVYPDEKNVVLNENSVGTKSCINRESKSDELILSLFIHGFISTLFSSRTTFFHLDRQFSCSSNISN